MQPNKTLAGWILLQDDLVEEFVDAIGLRVAHFGLGMLDVIQGQIQLGSHAIPACRNTPRLDPSEFGLSPSLARQRTAHTLSLSRSAAVIGILVAHSLAEAHLE